MQSEREKATGKKVRVNRKPWGFGRKRTCEWEEDISWWSTAKHSAADNGDRREVLSMLSGENSHFCLWVYFLIKKLYTFFNDINLLNSIWKLNEGFQCQNVTATICSLLRYPCFDPWKFTCCCSLLVYTWAGMSSLLRQTQVWSEITLSRGRVLPCTCVLTQVFAVFGPVCISVIPGISRSNTVRAGEEEYIYMALGLPAVTSVWSPLFDGVTHGKKKSLHEGQDRVALASHSCFLRSDHCYSLKICLFVCFLNSWSFRDLCSDGRVFLTEEVP